MSEVAREVHHDEPVIVGRESVRSTRGTGMNRVRERLFVAMNRSASSASRFFSLPPGQVFEVGSYVDI